MNGFQCCDRARSRFCFAMYMGFPISCLFLTLWCHVLRMLRTIQTALLKGKVNTGWEKKEREEKKVEEEVHVTDG